MPFEEKEPKLKPHAKPMYQQAYQYLYCGTAGTTVKPPVDSHQIQGAPPTHIEQVLNITLTESRFGAQYQAPLYPSIHLSIPLGSGGYQSQFPVVFSFR